jgi:hypothetical protein
LGQIELEKTTPNRARFFVRKKYTTFTIDRIVALRFVNKIFQESYDFAAKVKQEIPMEHQWQIF